MGARNSKSTCVYWSAEITRVYTFPIACGHNYKGKLAKCNFNKGIPGRQLLVNDLHVSAFHIGPNFSSFLLEII